MIKGSFGKWNEEGGRGKEKDKKGERERERRRLKERNWIKMGTLEHTIQDEENDRKRAFGKQEKEGRGSR